jgi:hypothetical protein
MSYIKIAALVAAAVLLAFPGAATATEFTSPSNSTYTGAGVAKAEGTISMHGVVTVTCTNSTFGVEVEQHGSSTTAGGSLTETSAECSNPVTFLKGGTGLAHTEKEGSNGNGTLTSSGAETKVEVKSLGITCVFNTNNTDIGLIEGNNEKNARVSLAGVVIPRTGGSFFCGSSAEITGSYKITTPSTLSVD